MKNWEWMIKQGYKFSDIGVVQPYQYGEFTIYITEKCPEDSYNIVGKVNAYDKLNALEKWLDAEHKETEDKPKYVKHAHWIDMRLDDVHVCSHCDEVVVFMNGNEPNYCPYCGARMDEKDDE